MAFPEGVASHQGGLSKGVPLYHKKVDCNEKKKLKIFNVDFLYNLS